MKPNYLIPIVLIIGLIVLFFFPEPETNFLAYVGTALFLVIILVLLIIKSRRKK
jgi:hypothetical protein